jgi:hypothetical protein
MNVVLLSIFQNSASRGHLPRYFTQCAKLSGLLAGHESHFRLVMSEGDSTDQTRPELVTYMEAAPFGVTLVNGETGSKRQHGSVTTRARLSQCAYAANRALAQVNADDDIAIYVESDIIWQPEALYALAKKVYDLEVDGHPTIVAPIPFLNHASGSKLFYDTWGFRLPGQPEFSIRATGPYPWAKDRSVIMDSVGTCLAMPGWVARSHRMTDAEAVVGLCRAARAMGVDVVADGSLEVEHPA